MHSIRDKPLGIDKILAAQDLTSKQFRTGPQKVTREKQGKAAHNKTTRKTMNDYKPRLAPTRNTLLR